MTNPITESDLSEIEARCEAATAGKWTSHESHHGNQYRYVQIGGDEMYTTLEMEPQDANFIATAREDVPRLVAEVRRLRAILGKGNE